MLRRTLALLALVLAVSAGIPARAEVALKVATIAPDGSSWMKLYNDWASRITARSSGQVKVKFFAGGVAGDERDYVRKMRLGQLEGAAMTGVGLGLIQPEVRVFDIPFLFSGYDDLAYVRNTLDAELRKKFEEKGHILLGWSDIGPVQLFTNLPVKTVAELRTTKLWLWSDDSVMRSLQQQLAIAGVPLGAPDVLPSLNTGLINACYGSPLAVLALQWHSKVKYITSMALAQSTGATVLTKKAWDSLTPEQQSIVRDESKRLTDSMMKQVRADNEAALKKLQALGLQVAPTPEATVTEFRGRALAVRSKLDGQVWTKEWRLKVEQVLAGRR